MSFRTLAEMLKQSVEKYSDLMCSQMLGNTKMTFKELGERVEKVKQMFVSAGLKEGDKVALYSSSHSNWAVCYMATVSAGMVIVPILPDFSEVELEKILEHSEAKALCVSDKLYTKVSKERVAKSNIVIRTKNLSVLAQNVNEQGSMVEPKPEDLAAIIYTSGTTSSPKGVMHTHQSLCSQLHLLQALFPIHRDDVWLSVLPLSHTYECSLGMLFPMSRGSNVTYLDRPPTVSVLLPALKQVRPTIMLIVPLIIEKIFKHRIAPVVDAVFKGIKDLWQKTLKPVLEGICDFLSGVFTADFSKAFEGLLKIVGGIWEGLKTVIKAPINAVIGMINAFIDSINGIKIPDWVPGMGGNGLLNIKKIPLLASGGVLERGQVGLLEGTGAEAVVPLEHNRAWLSKVAEDLNEIQHGNLRYNANPNTEKALERIVDLLEDLARMNIYLDSGALVGELAPAMDGRLSDRWSHAKRGNVR